MPPGAVCCNRSSIGRRIKNIHMMTCMKLMWCFNPIHDYEGSKIFNLGSFSIQAPNGGYRQLVPKSSKRHRHLDVHAHIVCASQEGQRGRELGEFLSPRYAPVRIACREDQDVQVALGDKESLEDFG